MPQGFWHLCSLISSSNPASSVSSLPRFTPRLMISKFLKILGLDCQAMIRQRHPISKGSSCAGLVATLRTEGLSRAHLPGCSHRVTFMWWLRDSCPYCVRRLIIGEQSPLVRPHVHLTPQLVPTSHRCHERRVKTG